MVPYKVQNLIDAPGLGDTHIGGYAGRLTAKFFEERIFSDDARSKVFKEAEDAFRKQEDDATMIGYWRGEFWGKLVISAVRVCRYTKSDDLREFLRKAARTMLSFQREDGYIGTYKNADFIQTPDPNETEKIIGWKCNWCWNVWCRKYTLWGLLECYQLLGDEEILTACRRMADHLIGQLKRLGLTLRDTGTFYGLPSCSIMKPMLVLYRLTGEGRYLDLCLETAANWDRADNAAPNLIANARSGRPLDQWYPDLKWAKAYEMMSCLDGLVELYRVTGSEVYLDTVKHMYDILNATELNPLFGVGFNDQFEAAANHINGITEPCDVIHWMRMCYELFTLTGEAKYMDSFELAYYNAFLAASFRDGKWGSRGVRSHGRHLIAHQCTFEYNHCCVDNMPRGVMNAAQAAVMHSKDALYLNLFTDFDASVACEGGTDVVSIRGSFTTDCRAEITVEHRSQIAEKVRIRVPAWSQKSVIRINGTPYTASCGWFEADLPANSVSLIALDYDNTPRLIPFDKPVIRLDPTDWKYVRWCNQSSDPFGALGATGEDLLIWDAKCRLMMGPILLSRSKDIGNTEEEMFSSESLFGKDCACTLTPIGGEDRQSLFEAAFTADGRTVTTKVCDYASAANMILTDEKYFSIWF